MSDTTWDFEAIAADHQVDYDSIGCCVCGESYPCTTLNLIAEVERLSAQHEDDVSRLMLAGQQLSNVEAERDRLRDRVAVLERSTLDHADECRVCLGLLDD